MPAVIPAIPTQFPSAGVPHVVFQNLSLLEAIGLTVVTPEFPIEPVESDAARNVGARNPFFAAAMKVPPTPISSVAKLR